MCVCDGGLGWTANTSRKTRVQDEGLMIRTNNDSIPTVII